MINLKDIEVYKDENNEDKRYEIWRSRLILSSLVRVSPYLYRSENLGSVILKEIHRRLKLDIWHKVYGDFVTLFPEICYEMEFDQHLNTLHHRMDKVERLERLRKRMLELIQPEPCIKDEPPSQ